MTSEPARSRCAAVQRVDYDQVASRYDSERYRGKEADPDLIAFLGEPSTDLRREVAVLDVGCGTGSQLVADRDQVPSVRMVGLDLSRGMLRQAKAKSASIHWVRGDAARLPFARASFDFVTSQFSFHHVREKAAMISEVHRVLRAGGRFVMTNIDPRKMRGWIVYRYFPAAWDRDLEDFWPTQVIRDALAESGFGDARVELRPLAFADDLRSFAQAARLRVTSQLAALSDVEYQAGMARVEADLRAAGAGAVQAPTELCLLKIACGKSAE